MEKIQNILGLWVHNESIMDGFDMVFIKNFVWPVYKKLNSPEGICPAEEAGPLERRKEILDNEEDKAYEKALRLLAKLKPGYEKYLPKKGKKRETPGPISDRLKKRIRLAIWVGTGNKIPFRELNEALVKNLLKEKGCSYRRKKGEMGWYRGGLFVGENLFEALGHLESLEAVDRSRLTVSF